MGGFLDAKLGSNLQNKGQHNATDFQNLPANPASGQNTGTNPLAQPTLGDNPVALAMLAAKRKAAQSARAGTFLSGPRGDSLLPSLQRPTLLSGNIK